MLLVSICIPAYNGAKTLRRTLDSIVPQVEALAAGDRAEIVLCDDHSRDETLAIAREYAARHPSLRLFANEKNLGMDGNFRQTALHARGKFVWYCGQDDLFGEGVVAKVLSIIEKTENLGFIFINYAQVGHDMRSVITPSMQLDETFDKARIKSGEDIYCPTPEDFFALFPAAPTFLPATIIRRDFWLETDVAAYEGTAFNQTAVILLNFRRAAMVVITKPMITGRVPDDQWQNEGQPYFRIMLGYIVMETLAHRDPRNAAPAHLYEEKKRVFLKNLFPLIRRSRHIGMKPTPDLHAKLRLVYGDGFLYYAFILPSLHLPLFCLDLISYCHHGTKVLRKLLPTRRAANL